MKKKIIGILLAGTLAAGLLSGCGASASAAPAQEAKAAEAEPEAAEAEPEAAEAEPEAAEAEAPAADASSDKKIVVGANPVPHADILDNIVKEVLAKDGWELETVVFEDYVLPNTSLEAGLMQTISRPWDI